MIEFDEKLIFKGLMKMRRHLFENRLYIYITDEACMNINRADGVIKILVIG